MDKKKLMKLADSYRAKADAATKTIRKQVLRDTTTAIIAMTI